MKSKFISQEDFNDGILSCRQDLHSRIAVIKMRIEAFQESAERTRVAVISATLLKVSYDKNGRRPTPGDLRAVCEKLFLVLADHERF